MYDSEPKQNKGESIEEVLPEAIEATATSGRNGGSRGEDGQNEQPRMAVMRAGSPLGKPGDIPGLLLVVGAVLLAALVVLAVALI